MAVVTGSRRIAVVDVAGTAWPLFKLEALAAGLIVFVIALVIGASMQVAVLGAAGVGLIVWLAGSAGRSAGSAESR